MKEHLSENDTLEPDAEGWYTARCSCGFSQGPFPGPVEVLDVLMDHAAEMARQR